MTLNANTKSGMDSIEFAKYFFSTILTLFPDAADTPAKRVAIVVDNGPRRVISSMIAQLRVYGFYLISGVQTHTTRNTSDRHTLWALQVSLSR